MTDPTRPGAPRQSSFRLVVPLLTVVALGAAVAWWLRPPVAPHQVPATQPLPAPAVETAPPASAPPPAAPRPAPKPIPSDKKVTAEPAPAAAPTAPRPTLNVSSDVDGAHVFVDRQYVGVTPLKTREVPAGRHQINVSAEGYDGVSESIDVAESGHTDLHVSLKTVRLDVSIPVVHKHAIGSCEGTLRADAGGLRYETANTRDAFAVPMSDLEVFAADYAQKTLRVKKRGGKTWNFTTRAPTADALVSFQQAVDHARQKLGFK